jgi:DNA-binding FadR family transcriptional regulator
MAKQFGEVRTVTMAELVAGALREQILDGRLRDGDRLPKQEDLAEHFDISGPSVREGLRILEAEGLISVRRGKFGGAFVHSPKATNAAYMLALVLEAKRVTLQEIGDALRDLEPVCAGKCAARPDRMTAVLPVLEDLDRQLREHDRQDYLTGFHLGLKFHQAIVSCSGSDTLITMIGALESIWFAHAEEWVTEAPVAQGIRDDEYTEAREHDHEVMLQMIRDGDVDGATRVARQHLEYSRLHTAADYIANRVIQTSLLTNRSD